MKNISNIRKTFIFIVFSASVILGCHKENPPEPAFTIEDNKITSRFCSEFGDKILISKDHVLIKSRYSIYIFKLTDQGIELVQTIDFKQSASILEMRVENSTLVFSIAPPEGYKVLIYERIGDTWIFKLEIVIKTANGLFFDNDGGWMVLGIPGVRPYGVNGNSEGRLYIYHKNNGEWKQEYEFMAEHPSLGDMFGMSVAINNDFVIAGSPWSLLHIFKYENTWALSRVDSMYIGEMNHCDSMFVFYDSNSKLFSFTLEPDGNFNYHPINFDFDRERTSGFLIKDGLLLVSGNWTNKCYLLKYENDLWNKKMVFEPDSGETCTFYGKAITDEYVILGGQSLDPDGFSYVYFRRY